MAAAVTIVAALGAGLWFGGGPTTRAGWEAAAWAAGITCALALAVNAIIWATTRTPSSPPQATGLPSHTRTSNTTENISGGAVIQTGSTGDLHTGSTSYDGDHIDFEHGTFHGPVTGKKGDRSGTAPHSNKEPDTEPDR
ncbi:hypothetical protein GCM10027590_36680 [Nocardiopsis nanhaiensis]